MILEATPDNDIGRFIAATLAAILKMSPIAFDKVFNDKIQDNYVLVYLSNLIRTQFRCCFCLQDNYVLVYLSNLIRTQFNIAEKLNTAAQIL
ncbi:uncharacterized protein A4U43_C08F31560 [Asparagus officinalis]|nr:uncharacterized protein A4U43_C08F31560 [Asparagus officinalis]